MILTLLLKSKFKILQFCQKKPVNLQNTFLKYVSKNKKKYKKNKQKKFKILYKKSKVCWE